MLSKVERAEHVLADHAGYHVVRGDDDVVADAALGETGVEGLVALIGVVYDVYLGIGLFKLGDDVYIVVAAVGDVDAPVVDVELGFCLAAAARESEHAHSEGEDKYNGYNLFLHFSVPLECFCLFKALMRS